MDKFIYISPSDNEERLVNISEVREIYRIGKTVGYSFKDGDISTALMETEEDAISAFEAISIYKDNGESD